MNKSSNNREERPDWIADVTHPVNTEWILYDSETQRLRFVKASSQKKPSK